MKRIQRPRMASYCFRSYFLILFTLLNFISLHQAHASGSKMPEVANAPAVISETPGTPAQNTDNGSVTPLPSGGGSEPTTSLGGNPFDRPWDKSGTSIVIDVYEGNSIDWNKLATDKKVVGIIHRSSIGSRVDKQYEARKKMAKDKGYLWGAYHLGYRGNTIAQADLFLSLVKDEPDTLMVLDLENTSSSTLMGIDEAVVFMQHIYEKTGRVPVVYANHSTTKLLNQKVAGNPIFARSKLWYARFTSKVTDFPAGIWKNYFLWQFSSELNCSSTGSCLYNVPGTLADMDVNVFYGSASELSEQWNNN